MEQGHSCEAAGLQPVKIFPALYGTRRFIITFTNATMLPYPEPDWSSPGPSLRSLPSPSRSSKWLFYLRVPNKRPYTSLFSPIRATCRARLVRLDLFTRLMFGAMSSVPSLYGAFDVTVTLHGSKKTRILCRTLVTQIQTLSHDIGYLWLWNGGNVVVYIYKQNTCNYNIYCSLHVSGNTKLMYVRRLWIGLWTIYEMLLVIQKLKSISIGWIFTVKFSRNKIKIDK